MALTLVSDCPHCLSDNTGFTFLGAVPIEPAHKKYWHVFFGCNRCSKPVVAQCHSYLSPHESIHGNLLESPNVTDVKLFPEREPSIAPEHVPAAVSRAFIEAQDAIRRSNWNSAAAMDRRTLEIVTKEKAPEKTNATLYERIEYLTAAGQLTRSLKDWAHTLRALGNEALHAIEEVDENEATQAHNLTRFILIYLYTLPKQVELARQLRENRHG